jgi:hypothetical protein
MTAREFTYTLAAVLLFTSSALGQTPLAWKFAEGQVFDVERSAMQKQTVEVKGKQFKQERKSVWHVRLEMREKKADALIILATLTKVEHQLVVGADAERIDPKLHEKMWGSKFTLRVTPAGRIVEMQGYEHFLSKLADRDAGRLKSLQVTFPEATLKEALADLFGPLPVEKEIAWQREYVESIPHFGLLRSTAKYEHVGTRKGRELIDYTIQSKYELLKEDKTGLFHVVKGSIDSEKAMGTIAFDRAAGRLLEHERIQRLHGMLTIETMDRQQPLEFWSENEVKIRVKPGK